jgi:hypothetical protein
VCKPVIGQLGGTDNDASEAAVPRPSHVTRMLENACGPAHEGRFTSPIVNRP